MKKNLNILCLIKPEDKNTFNQLVFDWKKYFKVEVIIDNCKKIDEYSHKVFDLVFIDKDFPISNEQYNKYKKANHNFSYILISDLPSKEDIHRFKNLTDRIIYKGISYDYTKWSSIASLRWFWDSYSKPSTIIYRNIIADFVEQKFMINQKEKSLTSKEIQLLHYFMNNRQKVLNKEQIFKDVWGYNTPDSTRTFDQMFFKLKSKIGREYFKVRRNKGIVFE